MAIVGFVLILGAVALAVAVAAITLWSGWRAFQDELIPGFRTVPPRPRTLVLTLVGVVLPLLAIAVFTLYLAITLLQRGVNAL
jgi:hypothetical protein